MPLGILVKAVIWPLRSYIAKVLHEYDGHQCGTLKSSMTVALSKPQEELGKSIISVNFKIPNCYFTQCSGR